MSECPVVVSDTRSERAQQSLLLEIDRWAGLARSAAEAEGGVGELTLTFVEADEITDLNLEHMGVVGPTDVLSFPMDDEPMPGVPTLLGDIVVCPEVAESQFAEHAGTFEDEIALLVVHGVLHVLGHDHADAAEATLMRAREIALLSEHHWRGDPPADFRQTHD